MERTFTRGFALCVAAAAVLAALPPSGASAAPEAAKITWGECERPDMQAFGAKCGLLSVPLDYSKPNGTKIQIAVSRLKANVAAKDYQGVMLVAPGGPGNSGLATSVLGLYAPNGAGAAYDWIGFDPRGVGVSIPALSCDKDYLNGPRPDYVPWNQSIETTWLGRTENYAKACGQAGGALLDHMTTADSVNDMESIRRALGIEQINIYGFSYGTYLGQVYGTLHPKQVRRMVLDANVDPRKVWYPTGLDQAVNFERNMGLWFDWVARYDSVYHLGRTGSEVSLRWYAEQRKLLTAPAGGVGPDEFADLFLYAAYYQWIWPTLAEALASAANSLDTSLIVATYEGYAHAVDDNGFAVYNAVQCTDTSWPQNWSTWKRDNWNTYLKAPFATWSLAWSNAPCLFWPGKISKPVLVDGSKVKSVLFVNSTLDAATPFENALEARRRFPHGALVAEAGQTTHANSFNGNPCISAVVADYLTTGKLPARKPGDVSDATCDALPQPDPTAVSAKARSLAADSAYRMPATVFRVAWPPSMSARPVTA